MYNACKMLHHKCSYYINLPSEVNGQKVLLLCYSVTVFLMYICLLKLFQGASHCATNVETEAAT